MDLNYGFIIVLTLLLIVSLTWAVSQDSDKLTLRTQSPQAQESHVKKTIISCRDGAIRGFVMGLPAGGLPGAFNGAVTWLLVSGTTSTMSDMFGWNTRL